MYHLNLWLSSVKKTGQYKLQAWTAASHMLIFIFNFFFSYQVQMMWLWLYEHNFFTPHSTKAAMSSLSASFVMLFLALKW